MNNVIISVDPGYATGVVIARNIDYTKRTYDLVDGFIVSFPDRAKLEVKLAQHRIWLNTLVIEDFLLFESKALAQSGSRFEATKIIERLTVYAEQLDIADRIKMQEPGLRLSAKGMPTEHLAKLCEFAPDPKDRRHLISAYQHLRYYVFWQSKQLLKSTGS